MTLTVCFGLLTGLAEASVRAARVSLSAGTPVFRSDALDGFWLSPLVDLALFSPIGVGFALGARVRPVPYRYAVFVLALLGVSSLRFGAMAIHHQAWRLLAVGIAWQVSRASVSYRAGFDFAVRRGLAGMAVLVPVLMVGSLIGTAIAERSRGARLLLAPEGSPNVLLIVLDTVRAQDLSLYGYERRTSPRLDRIAEKGVQFDRAISTCSWTLPSHASLFTGYFPHSLSADWRRPLDSRYPTLAEALGARGYRTGGFVANIEYCGRANGLDRGFEHYDDRPVSDYQKLEKHSFLLYRIGDRLGHLAFFNRRKDAARMNRDVLDWLPSRPERPFFAFINYFDAHEPYKPTPPFGPMNTPEPTDRKPTPSRPSVQERKFAENRDAYDGCIAYLDHQVGLLMDELQRRGLLDNTLVIITSDHGEQFGEHGLGLHGNSLYMPLLRVPLLIRFPNRLPEGRNVSESVTLRDLPATVMHLVGLSDKSPFPGASLARCWGMSGGPSHPASSPLLSEVSAGIRRPRNEPISRGAMKSLIVGEYHYIKNGDGQEELYDWRDDPSEEQDLSRSDRHQAAIEAMRVALQAAVRQGGRSKP